VITIEEEKQMIDDTLDLVDIPDEQIILTKTQFFMFYRKACVDRPIMTRLELVALGYDQFKSSGVVDRTNQLDMLAYKVHKIHSQIAVHSEEKVRIETAKSVDECAQSIQKYIETHTEPLDSNNNRSPYRRAKPMKCSACCWCLCPCVVLCVRCCCD